jgi:predicted small lipoprotein YifL
MRTRACAALALAVLLAACGQTGPLTLEPDPRSVPPDTPTAEPGEEEEEDER